MSGRWAPAGRPGRRGPRRHGGRTPSMPAPPGLMVDSRADVFFRATAGPGMPGPPVGALGRRGGATDHFPKRNPLTASLISSTQPPSDHVSLGVRDVTMKLTATAPGVSRGQPRRPFFAEDRVLFPRRSRRSSSRSSGREAIQALPGIAVGLAQPVPNGPGGRLELSAPGVRPLRTLSPNRLAIERKPGHGGL